MPPWKMENGVCRCCLAEGVYKRLDATCIFNDQEQDYCNLLKDCLNIAVSTY